MRVRVTVIEWLEVRDKEKDSNGVKSNQTQQKENWHRHSTVREWEMLGRAFTTKRATSRATTKKIVYFFKMQVLYVCVFFLFVWLRLCTIVIATSIVCLYEWMNAYVCTNYNNTSLLLCDVCVFIYIYLFILSLNVNRLILSIRVRHFSRDL